MRVGRLRGDGDAANVGWHEIHWHPFYRRVFLLRHDDMVAKDRGSSQKLAGGDQIEQAPAE